MEELQYEKDKADQAALAALNGNGNPRCTVCHNCVGFEPDIMKPKMCLHCMHPKGRPQKVLLGPTAAGGQTYCEAS